jgi:hypothetical protein
MAQPTHIALSSTGTSLYCIGQDGRGDLGVQRVLFNNDGTCMPFCFSIACDASTE